MLSTATSIPGYDPKRTIRVVLRRLECENKIYQQNQHIFVQNQTYKNITKASLRTKRRQVKLDSNVRVKCRTCKKFFLGLKLLYAHKKICGFKQHKCKNCPRKFTTQLRLIEHIQSNCDKEKVFCCDVCDKRFVLKKNLDEHKNPVCRSLRTFKCSICQKQFKTHAYLRSHIQIHGQRIPKNNFLCEICGKTFFKTSSFKDHLRVHTGEKPFHCKECNMKFSTNNSLYRHKFKHDDKKRITCAECGKGFSLLSDLKRHLVMHGMVTSYQHKCHVCGELLATRPKLHSHLRTHIDIKPNVCNICQSVFETAKELRNHFKIHSKETHVCKLCNISFSTLLRLLEHLQTRKHLKVLRRNSLSMLPKQNYVCSVCSNIFTSSKSLKEHSKIHSKEKLYSCIICGRKCQNFDQLKKHMTLHSTAQPHICNFCKKSFVTSSSLKDHVRIHTGEKPYNCKHCEEKFRSARQLRRHIQRLHKSVLPNQNILHTILNSDKFSNSTQFQNIKYESNGCGIVSNFEVHTQTPINNMDENKYFIKKESFVSTNSAFSNDIKCVNFQISKTDPNIDKFELLENYKCENDGSKSVKDENKYFIKEESFVSTNSSFSNDMKCINFHISKTNPNIDKFELLGNDKSENDGSENVMDENKCFIKEESFVSTNSSFSNDIKCINFHISKTNPGTDKLELLENYKYDNDGSKNVNDLEFHTQITNNVIEEKKSFIKEESVTPSNLSVNRDMECINFQQLNSGESGLIFTKSPKNIALPQSKDQLISCEVCKKTFSTKYNLTRHTMIVHGEHKNVPKLNIACKICNKEFTRSYSLTRHIKKVHNSLKVSSINLIFDTKPTISDDKLCCEPKYRNKENFKSCKQFGQMFTKEENQNIHSNDYKSLNSVEGLVKCKLDQEKLCCTVCKSGFKTLDALCLHMIIHDTQPTDSSLISMNNDETLLTESKNKDERNVCCYHCEMQFKNLTDLKTHIKMHTNKKFNCGICQHVFDNLDDLKQHITQDHQNITFSNDQNASYGDIVSFIEEGTTENNNNFCTELKEIVLLEDSKETVIPEPSFYKSKESLEEMSESLSRHLCGGTIVKSESEVEISFNNF